MLVLNISDAIVNPFDMRYVRDDLHIIAFFTGHPTYEAVEAMISYGSNGMPTTRAILTRHDQTQIDHINDQQLFAAANASGRISVFRHIEVNLDLESALPSATIRFLSHLDESVLLRLKCASPPDAKRGGITDPGQHASKLSLPVMLRGKSAMASVASAVEISTKAYVIPEKLRVGNYFVGHNGYFTMQHHMAILRSGARDLTVLQVPDSILIGQKWVYGTASGTKTYTVASMASDGEIEIVSTDGDGEKIRAKLSDHQLTILKIGCGSNAHENKGFSLSFKPDGTFSLDIDSFNNAVSGRYSQVNSNEVELLPSIPQWALARPSKVSFSRSGETLKIITKIGNGR